MAMSQEHKDALALGRQEARAIKAYLSAISDRKPGRPVTKETLKKRLENMNARIEASDDPLRTVDLVQRRLDIEKALSETGPEYDLQSLEAGFVEYAKAYSERKGISYTAWREVGVPAAVLKSADIPETRRR